MTEIAESSPKATQPLSKTQTQTKDDPTKFAEEYQATKEETQALLEKTALSAQNLLEKLHIFV